jgi:hypothetical protein
MIVDWKSAIISAISTGVVAAISTFVTNQGIGDSFKVAGIAAGLTFFIVFFTTLKNKIEGTAKGKKDTKIKMFIGQR